MGSVVPAVKRATSAIPIIFAVDADPVGRGLVASLARPGGNITGLSVQSVELVGKRLELLRAGCAQTGSTRQRRLFGRDAGGGHSSSRGRCIGHCTSPCGDQTQGRYRSYL